MTLHNVGEIEAVYEMQLHEGGHSGIQTPSTVKAKSEQSDCAGKKHTKKKQKRVLIALLTSKT